ncbi:hybrid sensor histidine kinase/response regulator transcription factor [Bacteroides sp. 51]|uniref:hybrid sensor histidine kinase/response regulator transcription factor n=1 Tax=Bacteroides sp. 51 TaxID=2302938 RepID=UPI0013CF6001|nr:hybrid sensor histidine kinase/response regulator transcription factor [Bacteroides sp. 51]NDV83112.1 hybrid sensor histidine kinase/response regulator [Bacteroides sp. 51]
MRKITPILLVFLLFPVCLYAREAASYYFTHINGENGLSQSNVKAILQDSYGFMWFGTKNGLNRYDGTSIIQINCEDAVLGEGNNNIAALYEDENHHIWVGTDRGIYIYNPADDIFTKFSKESPEGVGIGNWVGKILKDSINNIWVLVPDQGAFRIKDEQMHFYPITDKEKFKTESPNSICVNERGDVWIGTSGIGLFRYNRKKDSFDQYQTDRNGRSLIGKAINGICAQDDNLLFTIHEGELIRYNPNTNELMDIPLPASTRNIFFHNVEYINNEIWLGTFNGLFVINEERESVVHLKEDMVRPFSLSDNFIYTIYGDRSEGVWIGTLFGGVNYRPNRQLLFDKYVPDSNENSLSTKRIRELVEDADGNIWIGTENNGVNILNPKNGQVSRPNYGKGRNVSHQITLNMSYYNNQVYCGLFKQGMDVFELSQKSFRHYTAKDLNLAENSIYAFYVDSKKQTWIGNGWGLYMAPPGSLSFSLISDTGYDWIFDIMEDKDGIMWFATMGSGLWKHDPAAQTFHKYIYEKGKDNCLASNSVSSIFQNSRGTLWFSTDRGGICRYNPEEDNFTSYSIREGLPDDVAYKILEDDQHNLWFGTNRGLVKFNPDNGNVRIFTTKDGLLGNQFNYKSALKASDGKFYFGGIDGLISFDPYTADMMQDLPPVYISKFSIYNKEITTHTPQSPLKKSITHTDKIVLDYDMSNISFDVALLNYSTAEANQYYYRMDPVDNDWVRAASSQNISYAKLPPGEYIFRVRATHDGFNGQFASRSLSIVILPPWWKSVWAYIVYSIIGISLISYVLFWYRQRKEKQMREHQKLFEIEKEKELYESKVSFFATIAHEVRTPLTLINGPLETIQEMGLEDAKVNKNLGVIAQNTKRLLELTGQLLDFQKIDSQQFKIHFENVNVVTLLNETIARFEPTILQKKKELFLHIPEMEVRASIDKEAITRILSNLLNNALKYTLKKIMVEFIVDDSTFTIRVVSDGEKIPLEKSEHIFQPFYQMAKKDAISFGVGMGLPLARSLAEMHKGSLCLDTTQPENTFVLTIPLNKERIQQHNEIMVGQNLPLDEEPSSYDADNICYTLLVVEDEETMLDFMLDGLRESFTVECARNGKDALEILHNSHIDLVVSDIMMPVMNGWELCREIKSDIDLSHIPVIFLTAKNDLESKINGLKIGAEAYVEKPFSLNFLKNQVLSLLNNRRKEREAFSKRPFFPVTNMQLNKADEEFMNKVITIIDENIADENFNVERMADILCMSRSSLLRKIKILFNLYPVDFIRLIRLKKAAELIQEGKYLIGDICFMVGFNSASYFAKLFLKQFGMTPKEFEKQNQNLTRSNLEKEE